MASARPLTLKWLAAEAFFYVYSYVAETLRPSRCVRTQCFRSLWLSFLTVRLSLQKSFLALPLQARAGLHRPFKQPEPAFFQAVTACGVGLCPLAFRAKAMPGSAEAAVARGWGALSGRKQLFCSDRLAIRENESKDVGLDPVLHN